MPCNEKQVFLHLHGPQCGSSLIRLPSLVSHVLQIESGLYLSIFSIIQYFFWKRLISDLEALLSPEKAQDWHPLDSL